MVEEDRIYGALIAGKGYKEVQSYIRAILSKEKKLCPEISFQKREGRTKRSEQIEPQLKIFLGGFRPCKQC